MFKKAFCALAIVLVTTGNSQAVKKAPASECLTFKDSKALEVGDRQHFIIFSKNALENYEYAIRTNEIQCVIAYRDTHTVIFAEAFKALAADTLEPELKLKIAPLQAAFDRVMESGIDLKEVNKRIDTYYSVADAYLKTAIASKWVEDVSNDEMRGVETYIYSLESDDTAPLSRPYGESKATIILAQDEINGVVGDLRIRINVSDGQLSLPFDGGDVAMKSDDDKIENITSKVCNDKNRLICPDELGQIMVPLTRHTSHKMIIEFPFYVDGRYQFHFNTIGLITKRPTPGLKK